MLETGIRGEAKEVVSESNSAQAMKSGELKVYATPSMIALMGAGCLQECCSRTGGGKRNSRNVDERIPYLSNAAWNGSDCQE